jgi:hypothetical protein
VTNRAGDEAPPVLLLVFNRPDTTRRVFETLRQARPPRLYVAADGARPDRAGEAQRCDEVRRIATAVDWDAQVETLFRPANLGCRDAVSQAIAWFFDQEPEGIILEDDCLADPSFFRFCGELLARYRDDPSVAMISGDSFRPFPGGSGPSYRAIRYPHVWGWATWRRVWADYDPAIPRWAELRQTDWLLEVCDGSRAEEAHWRKIFDAQLHGEIDTWDYQWVFTCWLQRALSIVPASNLVTNIGFEPSGTHTRDRHSPLANLTTSPITFPLRHPASIEADRGLELWTDEHVLRPRRSRARRSLGALRRAVQTTKLGQRAVGRRP